MNKWICASFVLDLYVSIFFPGRNVWSLHQLSFLLLFGLGLHDIQNMKTAHQRFRKERRDVSMHVMSYYYFYY
jgi:hypothetical protein